MGQPSARGTDIELAAASGPGFSGEAKGAPGRAYEVVLRWVDERILSGDLAVGDHLPAERELARQLEVGRSAVREAMRTLVGAGAAGGTVITAVPSGALSRVLRLHVALANFPVDDVIQVRIALERLSVGLAAQNATAEQLATLRDLLEAMGDSDLPREEFNDLDTAFHVAVAAAAGNLLARDLTSAIRESMRLPILDRFRRLDSWSGLVPKLRRDHEEIYAAVASGEADVAQQVMERHIRSAWRSLTIPG